MDRQKKGFTLMEILAALTIWAVLITIVVINVTHYQPQLKVEKEAKEFEGYLLMARSLAMSGKIFKDENGDDILDVPWGYGVHLKKDGGKYSYFIFGDLMTENGTYDFIPLDEKTSIQEIMIDEKVNVTADSIPFTTFVDPLVLDIFFKTSTGNLYFPSLNPLPDEIAIEFSSQEDPLVSPRNVIINKSTQQIVEGVIRELGNVLNVFDGVFGWEAYPVDIQRVPGTVEITGGELKVQYDFDGSGGVRYFAVRPSAGHSIVFTDMQAKIRLMARNDVGDAMPMWLRFLDSTGEVFQYRLLNTSNILETVNKNFDCFLNSPVYFWGGDADGDIDGNLTLLEVIFDRKEDNWDTNGLRGPAVVSSMSTNTAGVVVQ